MRYTWECLYQCYQHASCMILNFMCAHFLDHAVSQEHSQSQQHAHIYKAWKHIWSHTEVTLKRAWSTHVLSQKSNPMRAWTTHWFQQKVTPGDHDNMKAHSVSQRSNPMLLCVTAAHTNCQVNINDPTFFVFQKVTPIVCSCISKNMPALFPSGLRQVYRLGSFTKPVSISAAILAAAADPAA